MVEPILETLVQEQAGVVVVLGPVQRALGGKEHLDFVIEQLVSVEQVLGELGNAGRIELVEVHFGGQEDLVKVEEVGAHAGRRTAQVQVRVLGQRGLVVMGYGLAVAANKSGLSSLLLRCLVPLL